MSGLTTLLLAPFGGMERFRSGFNWRTHSPEHRAQSAIDGAVTEIENSLIELEQRGASPEQVEVWEAKAIKLWVAYQKAGARTANAMITGPARFPVERNRKACEIERRRADEYTEHIKGLCAWLGRQERCTERAELSDHAATIEHKETIINGIRVIENTTLDRLQLIFEGKPEGEIYRSLKDGAFRWSPREGAWQRKLTANGGRSSGALHAARAVIAKAKGTETKS